MSCMLAGAIAARIWGWGESQYVKIPETCEKIYHLDVENPSFEFRLGVPPPASAPFNIVHMPPELHSRRHDRRQPFSELTDILRRVRLIFPECGLANVFSARSGSPFFLKTLSRALSMYTSSPLMRTHPRDS